MPGASVGIWGPAQPSRAQGCRGASVGLRWGFVGPSGPAQPSRSRSAMGLRSGSVGPSGPAQPSPAQRQSAPTGCCGASWGFVCGAPGPSSAQPCPAEATHPWVPLGLCGAPRPPKASSSPSLGCTVGGVWGSPGPRAQLSPAPPSSSPSKDLCAQCSRR